MLCLNEKDILRAVSLTDVLDAVESALLLYEKKDFHMPLRTHVDYQGNTLLLMPAFIPGVFGTKLVSLFPKNAEKNIPVLKGTMILNDGETGEPLALLDAASLTALRTGAVGGTGVKYLSPDNVDTLGIVGAGVQGFHQAWFATEVRDFKKIAVFDVDSSRTQALIQNLSARRPAVKVYAASTAEQLVKDSQVIITATTAEEPVLPNNEDLLKGKHVVAVGCYKPTTMELPEALYKHLECLYVDTEHAMEEAGDLVIPLENQWIKKEQVFTLGKLIDRTKQGKVTQQETTLFKSVGMALFDVVVSKTIYQNAIDKNLGREVVL